MSNRARGVPGLTTGQDLVGANLGAFEQRLSALEQDQAAQTSQTVDAPEIDTSLALIFTRDEHRGVYVTIPYRIPGRTFAVRTIIVKRSEITDADSYEEKRIRDKAEDVTDADRVLGKFQRRFDNRLKYESVYDIIRIVAQDEDGDGIASNPAEEPEFAGYPGNVLLSFTTPVPFQAPSNPSLADLVTQLDPATKAFDAFARFTVRAPLSDSGAVQTFAQAQVPEVVITIADADGSNAEKIPHQLTDADLNRTSVVVTKKGLKPGAAKLWVNNIAWRGNDKRISTEVALAFTGAGFGTNPNLLTVIFTADSATEPYNPKMLQIKVVITQPATVQALKLAKIDRKLQTDPDANYALNLIEFNLQDDQYHQPGASFTQEGTIPVKPNRNYTLRLRLNCIGDVQRIITINHSTGSDPDVSNDTGKPAGLAKPLLRYIAGTGIHFEGLQATTNTHTMNGRRFIVLADTLNRFFNFGAFFSTGSLTLTLIETEGVYRVDKGHGNIRVKLKHLKQAFGAAALLRLRWYAENDFGLSDPSEYSDTINLSTAVDIVNSKDAVNVADASLAPPGVQLLDNSDYLRLNGTDVRDWQRWSGVFPISSNLQPINTGSANVRLSTANHSLQWTSQLQYLVTNLKRGRILPGQMYNLGVALRSIPVSFFGLELRAYIFPDNGSLAFSNIVNEFAKVPLDGVTPIYKVGGVAIQIKDLPSLITENQWLCFFLSGFGSSLSSSQFLEWDRPMFNRGVAPVVWTPKESEEGADYTPTGLSNISDQIQYVGSRGGYTDEIGTGAFILPEL